MVHCLESAARHRGLLCWSLVQRTPVAQPERSAETTHSSISSGCRVPWHANPCTGAASCTAGAADGALGFDDATGYAPYCSMTCILAVKSAFKQQLVFPRARGCQRTCELVMLAPPMPPIGLTSLSSCPAPAAAAGSDGADCAHVRKQSITFSSSRSCTHAKSNASYRCVAHLGAHQGTASSSILELDARCPLVHWLRWWCLEP